ncbi:stAR-related lipid transfer protein 3-like [Argiope bruennichi]|uniref:stAR-related lipid transfer protein 3-like n=1 Tax=Argiope bruennichi TaxID=94029 RepID=UPI002493D0B4|nr:stAR-related lipid transfer protein 3-like [Argiope bruennichi]
MGTNRSNYPQLLQNPSGLSHSSYGSVNGNYSAAIEPSIMEGLSVEGRLSMARRFFILLTVFDVLFTFLIWIICTVVSGGDSIDSSFRNEVINYNIETSMFDIVVLAVARLFLIALVYIFLRLSHWWMVFVTTAGTTVFIIAKVFLYKWAHSNSTTASVVLLLCSFILSWGEAWFLDFRVLPRESKALAFLAKYDEDQAPVLSHPPLSRSQSEDGSAFYSPPGSDGEDNGKEHDGSTVSEVEWLSPKNSKELPTERDYRKLAEEALHKAIAIIEADDWKKEKISGSDIIYSKVVPPYGKVFKFEGIVPLSPMKVVEILYFKAEEMHKWNPTVKRVKVIQKIDEYHDIAHVIATEGAAGLVSSRDFVNVRIWKKKDSGYVHGSVGITHPDVPVKAKYVRGEQGPTAYIMTPADENGETTKLQWLLNTNLKGWIPQYLIDQTLSIVMMEYINSLRKFSANKTNV